MDDKRQTGRDRDTEMHRDIDTLTNRRAYEQMSRINPTQHRINPPTHPQTGLLHSSRLAPVGRGRGMVECGWGG